MTCFNQFNTHPKIDNFILNLNLKSNMASEHRCDCKIKDGQQQVIVNPSREPQSHLKLSLCFVEEHNLDKKLKRFIKKIQIISLLGVPFFHSSLHGAMMPCE